MTKPLILVTAAAGNTGFPTAQRLLDKGFGVRALVRRPSARAEALRAAGAELVQGSLDDAGDVQAALVGVQRAYFCPPLLPGLLDKAALFAAVAEEQRLEFVVAMSQWLADPGHPSIHTRQAWLSETVLRQMPNVATAVVNPGWFADNYLAGPELITQFGLLPLPLGDGLNAPPSNEDIGAVVAGMLARPDSYIGARLRPTGPTLLSPQQIVAAIGKAIGRTVRYVNTPISMFARVSRGLGLPDYTAAQVLHYFADYQRNAFADGAPSTVVADVTGRPAEDLATIAARYLAPYARRTVTTRLGATGRLLRGMLRGSADLDVIARTSDFDMPHASLAADSPSWKASHRQPGRTATAPSAA